MINDAKKFLENVNQEITKLEKNVEYLKKIAESVNAFIMLGEPQSLEFNALMADIKSNENISGNKKLEAKTLKDYPLKGKFLEKIKFLNEIHPYAWKTSDRIEIIKSIEGPQSKTLKSFSQKVKNLVYSGDLIAAKFSNSNKHTFFMLPEWRTDDKKPTIKLEHAPAPEAFGNLPEEKRKPEKIEWLETKK